MTTASVLPMSGLSFAGDPQLAHVLRVSPQPPGGAWLADASSF